METCITVGTIITFILGCFSSRLSTVAVLMSGCSICCSHMFHDRPAKHTSVMLTLSSCWDPKDLSAPEQKTWKEVFQMLAVSIACCSVLTNDLENEAYNEMKKLGDSYFEITEVNTDCREL